jgi:hypothetical protein
VVIRLKSNADFLSGHLDSLSFYPWFPTGRLVALLLLHHCFDFKTLHELYEPT